MLFRIGIRKQGGKEEPIMHTCKSLMNKDFRILYPDSTVEEAVDMLRTDDSNPDGVFVVESRLSRKLVGSASGKDILMKGYAEDKSPSETQLKEVMNQSVVIAGEETTIEEALLLMLKNSIRCIPIVDRQNTMVGVLSMDMVRESAILRFSWSRLFKSADSHIFDTDFERTREAYEERMEIELANLLSMIDIMQLKSRVAAHEANLNIIRSSIFEEINKLKDTLEKRYFDMKGADEDNWYLKRDLFEKNRHALNEKLFTLKDPIERLAERDYPVSADGPIRSPK